MPSASVEAEPLTDSARKLADEVNDAAGAWLAATVTVAVFGRRAAPVVGHGERHRVGAGRGIVWRAVAPVPSAVPSPQSHA